jgi:hypothetical protein
MHYAQHTTAMARPLLLLLLPAGEVFPLSAFENAVAESQKVGRLGKVLLKMW